VGPAAGSNTVCYRVTCQGNRCYLTNPGRIVGVRFRIYWRYAHFPYPGRYWTTLCHLIMLAGEAGFDCPASWLDWLVWLGCRHHLLQALLHVLG
jgi:hypothetical protein